MLQVLVNTILPIFSIILLGYVLYLKKIIPPAFTKPANQIIYYVALPAMFFLTTAKAPLRESFDVGTFVCTLAAELILAGIALVVARLMRIPRRRLGTFLQSSYHGNIGYMSFAIIFFALGSEQFSRVAILSSLVLVGQNFLSIWIFTKCGDKLVGKSRKWAFPEQIVTNPIIIAIAVGVLYSAIGLSVPSPVQKALDILSGMAFPTALLLIGASLSFGSFRSMVKELVGIGLLKLICLPLIGYVLMTAAHVPPALMLPATIILASPPATMTYIMATELGGDPELAATSISLHTLLSAVSYSFFLSWMMVRG